jgi:hypothetical protein
MTFSYVAETLIEGHRSTPRRKLTAWWNNNTVQITPWQVDTGQIVPNFRQKWLLVVGGCCVSIVKTPPDTYTNAKTTITNPKHNPSESIVCLSTSLTVFLLVVLPSVAPIGSQV